MRKRTATNEDFSKDLTLAQRWGRRGMTLLLGLCPAIGAAAASFQMVVEFDCGAGAFVVDARPFAENEAGSSRVDIRYRYKGETLPALWFENHYRNLDPYLQADKPHTLDLGMQLDRSREAQVKHGFYESGDTLYLPPSRFSPAEFDALAKCLRAQSKTLRSRFAETLIRSRILLGLTGTETSLGRQGIARIIHAEAPLLGVYGEGWYLVLVERSGRVLLHTRYTPNSVPSSAVVGQLLTEGSKPVIRATRKVNFAGKSRDATEFLRQPLHDGHGRDLGQDYGIAFD